MLPATRNSNRLNNLVEQFFGDSFPATAQVRSLPLSAWEDENTVHVEMDLPGVATSDIDISVHGRVLTVRGERKNAGGEGRFDTRTYGGFEQRIGLPAPVDADKVEAKLAGGVLSLTLPKSEAAKPRKIEVRA